MQLTIPELSLVVLVGPPDAGQSAFARKHFAPSEILSADAFGELQALARARLALGKLTVVDAADMNAETRKALVTLTREHHCRPVAIGLGLPRDTLRRFESEGFRHVFILQTPEEIDAATITRQPLWNDRRQEHGPFDIIGDVHGCFDELRALLDRLGYVVVPAADGDAGATSGWGAGHPDGRRAVFLGDLVDRGPKIPDVLRLVMRMVAEGTALCVPGNHDIKLMRKLRGKNVALTHGLAESVAQLEQEPPAFAARVADFVDGLVSHFVLDDGKLVVAHAGLPANMQGRGSGKVRDFALHGQKTGETDEYGFPIRYPWANDYRGGATVVYGHTPILEAAWVNRTLCIDTGCVFGGRLTALRYPEREIVSVPAAAAYYPLGKPSLPRVP